MDRLLEAFLSGPMLTVLARFVAIGFEKYLIEDYVIPVGKSLDAVRGPKRRCRIDPDADLELLQRCASTYGDGAGVAELLLGDRRRLQRLMHAHNVLHLGKLVETFGSCTHFHVAADPASYSGEQT